ncbi:ArnT family glycosyltransferase [Paraburkholderia azotifigens]|uniref:Glycosyl transferase n=1 Tax=Paraburkholderia azotifigens TaxID=2057004 RepID=A0A5C6VKY5_9BURK|nr:glycosyl transferase [Paraburkholderia azotifigens]TXC86192.1 glycosyl transferase [Paraburkholderia azotifigens]
MQQQNPSKKWRWGASALSALFTLRGALARVAAAVAAPLRPDEGIGTDATTPLPPAPAIQRLIGRLAASRAARWTIGIALVCAWLLPGMLGHDPWKQDETYTFGIVQHMLDTGDLVVPTNAGQPFVEKPPIYDWVAAGTAWLFSRYLPLHDGARLASAVFGVLTLLCLARIARRSTDAPRWLDLRVIGSLALFAGTLVVVKHAHDMMTDVALMAGAALGFCGLFELVLPVRSDAPIGTDASHRHDAKQNYKAAAMFGAGVGIALMSKGLFVPLVFGATLCAALALYPACRSLRFARALALAACVFAPFALIWPVCFYLRSEALFKVWLWDNNVGRFFGFSVPELGSKNDDGLFVLKTLLTVGFPVVPLALVALVALVALAATTRDGWRQWREPRIALPLIFAGTGFAVLQTSATIRELYILPFIAPLAPLAARAIERLPQRLHTVWDIASRVLFAVLAVLAWTIWSTMTNPAASRAWLHLLGRWLPLDWTLPIRPVEVTAALALTVGWLWLLPLVRRTGKWRGALSWCAGAIVAWGLVGTLLLPWLDLAKSYRSVFEDLRTHLDAQWNAGDCMASVALGESEAPMLDYFAGIEHMPLQAANTTASSSADAQACTWLIVQMRRQNPAQPGEGWKLFWSGARPGDNDELLRVFVRTPSGAGE